MTDNNCFVFISLELVFGFSYMCIHDYWISLSIIWGMMQIEKDGKQPHCVEFPVHWGQQKISCPGRVSVLPFLAVTCKWSNNKTVKDCWKQVWKIRKMAAESRRYFSLLSKAFSGNFFRAVYPSRAQLKFREWKTKTSVFITVLGLKDCGGTVRNSVLQTFVLIFPWKSTHLKIHTKMASFWFVSIGKNPAKSDKLALVEAMLMNLMFLVIYIPVVPFENWLRVTHSQRREC